MTHREMFEKSFERPCNFFELSAEEQWAIDKALGILDWDSKKSNITPEDIKRFNEHYGIRVE